MANKTVLLVVPANNNTMEGEMKAHCPEVGRFLTARVHRKGGMLTAADLRSYGDSPLAAIEPFMAETIDLVAFGCTAAGFIGGPAGNQKVVDMLQARSGRPVVSTAGAMVAGLQHAGARRIDVVTPYLDEVNAGLRAFLAASDIEVSRLESFLCPDVQALGRVTAEEVEAKALATARDGDTLFIACSQLPTAAILPGLRQRLRRPVWSSVQSTAWMVLRELGLSGDRIDGGRVAAAKAAA
jgi:maleate cis-trans isomerase